jgi:hypothetical protein
MTLAFSTQNVIVVVIVALAVLLIGRQFYRLATGKSTKCSCCPGCKTDEEETTPPCDPPCE